MQPVATASKGYDPYPDVYRQIMAHSNEPIAIISSEGFYIQQNAAHRQLLGYSDEELENETPALHLGAETYAAIVQDLAEKGEYKGEVISRTKTGETRFIELSAFAIKDKGGKPLCYVGIKHDLTKRKRAERRLILQYAVTKILSQSSDFLESAQKILKTICLSLEWELGALWKVDTGVEILRCVDVWHVPSSSAKEFEALTRRSLFTKGVGLPGRIWATGEPAWIPNVAEDTNFPRGFAAIEDGLRSAFGFPIRLGTEVLGVIEFFSGEIREPDSELLEMVGAIGGQIGQFTKRKRVEEELAELLGSERAARADAEQANRLKDEFLATLSHELRTPLNAVIGWSRMLRSGRLDPQSSVHALEVIERNSWAQKQIIEDILDVSRVITGKLQLKVGAVDLVTVVDGALDAMRPALEAKNIRVETIIDAGLRMISGDADRLQQVVWNLLSNATKFTPNEGKIEIRVGPDQTNVQIQVRDTGPGIEPSFLPYVFERFRQADGSTTRTHGGLGLGLAIVRHLVELHGGTISAENRKESGAIFTVKLPLPTVELLPETLATAASVYKEAEAEPLNLDDLHILVVDDETDALDLISMELTQRGAAVTSVSSATEALAALQHSEFDLLISDIGMPDIDGYDLIRQVRRREAGQQARIPAVALTAYARVQDRMRAILAGYNTHVAKPVDASELVTVVAGLAGRLGKN